MRMALHLIAACALGLLAACSGPAERIWAPDADVQRFSYEPEGPPSVTLVTVISTRNGSGAHSSLLIDADERLLFDPAGTFRHPHVPERNDVLHGVTPRFLDVYIDYHARETYDVQMQRLEVSPEVAARLTREVQNYGAVPKAQCSLSISRILSRVPEFEDVPVSYMPLSAARAFGARAGVTTRVINDDDADTNHGVLILAAREIQASIASAE